MMMMMYLDSAERKFKGKPWVPWRFAGSRTPEQLGMPKALTQPACAFDHDVPPRAVGAQDARI